MGTLLGHILPGSFFIGFSVWWTYAILYRYFQSRANRQGEGFRSSSMYSCSCLPRIPVEGILKLLAVCIGITGEFVTGFKDGHWEHWGNAQHISMFFFFGISGLMDVLYFYKFNLPPGLEYATALIAFIMEGLLFANHLHGRTHMDVMIHTYLLYAIMGGAACVLLEGAFRNSVVPALGRTYFTLIQGTWFYQVGFILYPPQGIAKWNEEDHGQMMIVTVIYSWHYAGVMLFMLLVALCVSRAVKKQTGLSDSDSRTDIQYQKIALNSMENGQTLPPRIPANGAPQLRLAFEDTSEDEV